MTQSARDCGDRPSCLQQVRRVGVPQVVDIEAGQYRIGRHGCAVAILAVSPSFLRKSLVFGCLSPLPSPRFRSPKTERGVKSNESQP